MEKKKVNNSVNESCYEILEIMVPSIAF